MTPLQRLQSFVASNTGDNVNTMLEMSREDTRKLLYEIDVMVADLQTKQSDHDERIRITDNAENLIASRCPSKDFVTEYLLKINRSAAQERIAYIDAWIKKQYHEGRLA